MAKDAACARLKFIGTDTAVPALAALLPDEHLSAYARSGRRDELDAYLEKYIYGPKDHVEYLERIGFSQILSLYEF